MITMKHKRKTNLVHFDLDQWTMKDIGAVLMIVDGFTHLERRLICEQILKDISDGELKLLIITLQSWMVK
jgi:hypothetical protein